ncbi:MAG: LuxR C-terminal-related transcriptional regulator [Bacteroidota bacterium]
MRAPQKLVKSVWEKYPPTTKDKDAATFDKELVLQKLGSIFCPGPFFFMVLDFSRHETSYVSPQIVEILGQDSLDWKLKDWIESIHPEDRDFMAKCEWLVGEFLFDFLSPELIMTYKSVYCYRMRREDGSYGLFMQQAMPLKIDGRGIVISSIAILIDVSHLNTVNNYRLSLISMENGRDYLGLDPYKGSFEADSYGCTPISSREREVLTFLAEGDSLEEIGEKLFISPTTVRTHRNNIRRKLDCQNIGQAVAKAIREGWI